MGERKTPGRRWRIAAGLVAGLLLIALAGYAVLKRGSTGRRADLAAGYVAHVVCSCRYVGHRDLKSCATDFEPGMEIVRMSDDPAARRITAWVPLLAQHTATYSPDYGCALDRR